MAYKNLTVKLESNDFFKIKHKLDFDGIFILKFDKCEFEDPFNDLLQQYFDDDILEVLEKGGLTDKKLFEMVRYGEHATERKRKMFRGNVLVFTIQCVVDDGFYLNDVNNEFQLNLFENKNICV